MSITNNYIEGNIVMGVKDLPSVSNYIDLHTQAIRKIHITVECLDNDNRTIGTLQGIATGGSIDISGESLIRRTGSIEFVYVDELLPNKHSPIWITNKIRVYAGIENLSSRDSDERATHFCLGTFYISEPNVNISQDGRSISITLEDYMMKWEEHETETVLKLEADTPLHTAVENVMNLHGEWNTRVQFSDLTIPHLLEYPIGTNVTEILETLRDLYMDWQCYYDVDGTFVFERLKIQREDGEPVAWRFDGKEDLITSMQEQLTYKDLKNRVVVFGGMNEKTGETPKSEANIDSKDSPFHKDEIGERKRVVVEESYGNNMQCDSRARYELFKSSTFQEKMNISTVPIYYLDANNIIEAMSPTSKTMERYVIDSISLDLSVDSEMNITCHKVYYDHFDIVGDLGSYQKSADIIEEGIINKGWLSLSEDRIKEFYGMEGNGSELIIRFEYNSLGGTTAYTTGYVGSTTQSITIDLADFNESKGDSGDNGTGKAEYADRVLGHEMVHVVMNDYLTVKKSIELPYWFREGLAEFIHGADERLKLSIVKDGKIVEDKLNKIVERANQLVKNYSWKGDSDDYTASYLIVKYLDKNFNSGKSYKNILSDIKKSNSNAKNALEKAIEDHSKFVSYDNFAENIKSELNNFVKTKISLELNGDELDTGSVGGSDHRGNKNLNAEDVFDNKEAVRGIEAKGFKVDIRKP